MRKNSQTSVVWNYFEKLENGAKCLLCKCSVSCFGNTSNLVKHLRRRHNGVLSAGALQRRDAARQDSSDCEETEGEGIAASEEDPNESVNEPGTAVHTIQAYRDANGTTFLYLQPAPEGEQGVQIQNAQFQPVVASSESITANGEIVSLAVQKEPSHEGPAVESEPKTHEEAASKKIVNAPVKTYQGSSVAPRAVVRQLNRPNPIKTVSRAASSNNLYNNTNNNNNNSNKEDTFEAFGKYIASMLRNLPSTNAWKLQGEIVNWILKEQIKNSGC